MTTWRLDMSSAPGTWKMDRHSPHDGQTSALPTTRAKTSFTRWVEMLHGGGFFDSTSLVNPARSLRLAGWNLARS